MDTLATRAARRARKATTGATPRGTYTKCGSTVRRQTRQFTGLDVLQNALKEERIIGGATPRRIGVLLENGITVLLPARCNPKGSPTLLVAKSVSLIVQKMVKSIGGAENRSGGPQKVEEGGEQEILGGIIALRRIVRGTTNPAKTLVPVEARIIFGAKPSTTAGGIAAQKLQLSQS